MKDHLKKGFPFNPLYSDGFSHTYYDVFLSLKVIVIIANSVHPNEMQQYAAFHLGIHCLPKYLTIRLGVVYKCLRVIGIYHHIEKTNGLQRSNLVIANLLNAIVLPAKSESDFMFCLQSYQVLTIDRSLVFIH